MATPSVPALDPRPQAADDTRAFLQALADHIDYAFQPIINSHSGQCYGVEALLRGWEAVGAARLMDIFDFADARGILVEADAVLRRSAFAKFSRIPHARQLHLFFNLDNRLFARRGYDPKAAAGLLEQYRLSPASVVLEVTERQHPIHTDGGYQLLDTYRDRSVQVALDDFGTGVSGLALLYDTHPEFIKIDRYFISGIDADYRKKQFVAHVVSLAKTLGIQVVAEGVETEAEFTICRDIGCDLAQGYLIQRPTTRLDQLAPQYAACVSRARSGRRRRFDRDPDWTAGKLDAAPVVDVNMQMTDVLEAFRQHADRSFFPFLGADGRPIGVIRETSLRSYIYSPYGHPLLTRKRAAEYLDLFVQRCPIAEIHTPIDTLLEQFAANPSRDGVLITEDGTYRGVLQADVLILAAQERTLELARDQNPLTKLPGNPSIERFIEARQSDRADAMLLYFDLNHFKAFNDVYGFRLGDRALILFADLLRKTFESFGAFIGHICGDDFFVGVQECDLSQMTEVVHGLQADFRSSIAALYSARDRGNGYIQATDRRGHAARFPLISASCAAVFVNARTQRREQHAIVGLITCLKAHCKQENNGFCAASLL